MNRTASSQFMYLEVQGLHGPPTRDTTTQIIKQRLQREFWGRVGQGKKRDVYRMVQCFKVFNFGLILLYKKFPNINFAFVPISQCVLSYLQFTSLKIRNKCMVGSLDSSFTVGTRLHTCRLWIGFRLLARGPQSSLFRGIQTGCGPTDPPVH
jgi:hypothetical protein